ncbi:hypothetical protein [Arthrobacter sp. Soil762]|nr:hypothetical protein [Arthrobacter sp. Soil762]
MSMMTSRRWKRNADISLCLLIRAGAPELDNVTPTVGMAVGMAVIGA